LDRDGISGSDRAVETKDSEFNIRIPIGVTMQF